MSNVAQVKYSNMKKPLLKSDLRSLVGKTIKWTAEAYKMNMPYHGVEQILKIDMTKEKPIIKTELIDIVSDNLCFAFVDDHSLEPIENGFKGILADGSNNCLSYSDSYREIFYEIVE